MKINYVNTIIFNQDGSKIAYLKKLSGPKFLIGRYNFVGGKVEVGETSILAAAREIQEEAFVNIDESLLVSINLWEEEDVSLETFIICLDSNLFSQIKQSSNEPIFIDDLNTVKNDAVLNPSLYSEDFLYFLNKGISTLGG